MNHLKVSLITALHKPTTDQNQICMTTFSVTVKTKINLNVNTALRIAIEHNNHLLHLSIMLPVSVIVMAFIRHKIHI
jgi:hypothetical protein